MSLYSDISWGRDSHLSQAELNRRAKIVADAIEALRVFVPDWEQQVAALRDVGLGRINDALLPAYQQIAELAHLGALLSASSSSSVEIGLGAKTFVLPEATRRNFAPTPFLMATAGGDFDTSMIGTLSSYDVDTGVLVIAVERVAGEGTFDNWKIGPVASTDDLEALRDQVVSAAGTATTKAAEAGAARDQAVPASAAAVTALGTFQAAWHGSLETAPEGADLGSKYLDTSVTPNVVRVLTEAGWAPTAVTLTQSTEDDTPGRAVKTGDSAPAVLTGLGTAATADVTTSPTDDTEGRLLKVGDSRGILTPRPGEVLQVVHASTTTEVTVASTTWTDTTLTATITPISATSKIEVVIDQQVRLLRNPGPTAGGVRLLRDAVVIHDPLADATGPFELYYEAVGATTTSIYLRHTIAVQDSPSTTGPVTYKTQARPRETSGSGQLSVQRNSNVGGRSYITLREIAG